MRKFTISLIFIFLTALLLSQNPPDVEWISTFGGTEPDYCSSFIQTSDGGYIITGGSHSFDPNSMDLWVIKLDSNGYFEWENSFGDWNMDRGYDIIQNNDGYIICGSTASYGAGSFDAWVIKIDNSGNEIWSQTYGGIEADFAHSIIETSEGNFIFFGSSASYGAGSNDVWLVKLDSTGNMLWEQTFGGNGTDETFSGQQTSDGGYIMAGYTNSFGAGQLDVYLIKTDLNGNLEWSQTFGGVGNDETFSVCETDDNGFIIAGSTQSFGLGSYDYWVIKTDNSGNIEWNQTYGTVSEEYLKSIIQTTSGDFIIYGDTYDITHHLKAYKIDSIGNVEWEFSSFDGMFSPYIDGVVQSEDNGYVFIGDNFNSGNCVIIKLVADVNAIFSAIPVLGYNPLTVSFIDESTGNISTWHWDFNNDGIIDSFNQNPTFTYTQPGIYSVALTVSDWTNEDTIVKEDYILVLEPINADFVGDPLSGNNPLEVNFTDLSSGVPTSWLWDFDNDGFIDSNEQNPIHVYYQVGSYTVSLTVSDGTMEDTETKVDYITITLVGSHSELIPLISELYFNHPNPFNPVTTIQLDIKENESGILTIYNIKGQLIESNKFESGQHNYIWDATGQSSGLYFYKLQTESITEARKMLLLK